MSPERLRPRIRPRPAPARSFYFLGFLAALLIGSAGGVLLFFGLTSRPVPQAFHAAFPEALLGPGRAEILVRLEDPFTHRPRSGQVRVLIEGSGRRKEVGLAPVEGTTAVPFLVPALKEGGYRLVVQALGGEREEELSADVDVDTGNRMALIASARETRPGETVRVMAMGRRLLPARPAAGEPWVVTLIGPRGNQLFRSQGTTDAGGSFSLGIPFPASTTGGRFGLEAEIGTDLLGSREILVPEEPEALQVRPRLARPYAVAGQNLEGEVEILGADGLPSVAGQVRVGFAPGPLGPLDEQAESEAWVDGRPSGPGRHAFSLPLPPMEPDQKEPEPIELEARFLEPGADLEARMPFRIHLVRAPHRLVLETPSRWVEGLPHRVRLEVLDLAGTPRAARVEALQDGEVLAGGECDGSRALALTLIPRGQALSFRAVDAEGRELCTRSLALDPPPVRGLDFTLTLQESVLAPGSPLRVEVHSKRTEDRLWVDLLLEGMVTALFPVVVHGGEGNLEIPADRIPQGFFQVRVWRWDPEEVPSFEVSCLAQGNGCLVQSLESFLSQVGKQGAEESIGLGLPDASFMAVVARPGPFSPYALPEPVTAALSVLPGTFGLTPTGLVQLLRALAQGGPLPSIREELVPNTQESWSAYGPPILAAAESKTILGVLASALGLLLGAGVAVARLLKAGAGKGTRRTLCLLAALSGVGLVAQEPAPPPPTVDPIPLAPWWWGLESATEYIKLPPESRPPEGGLQHLGMGGQSVRDGSLILGWGEWEWAPGWECRAAARGPLWPGDEVRVPCWWRLAGPGGPSGDLWVAAGAGTSIRARFPGPWVWQGGVLQLGALAPGQGAVPVRGRDEAGKEFVMGALGLSRPAALEMRKAWSGQLAGRLELAVPRVGAGEERFRLELFPDLRSLALGALSSLWAGSPGLERTGPAGQTQAPWGSLDRVIGWGRFALALLDGSEGSTLAGPEEERLRTLAGRTLERAWMELTAFERPGGGFASFPAGPRQLAPSAAALEFLVEAGPRLPESSAGAMASRAARWLSLMVREDGSVLPDAGTLAMGLWSDVEDGRFYFSALVGAALARFRAKNILFTGIDAYLVARLQEPHSLLERLAAARALLNWDAAHPRGLALLGEAAEEARSGTVHAGLHAWNGAGGERADLLAAGTLGAALARADLAPEVAAALRGRLLAQVDADHGWGDPWTSAACLDALVRAPVAGGLARGETRLLVAGKEVWRGALDEARSMDLGARPTEAPFEVVVEGGAGLEGGLALLTLSRRVEPTVLPGPGPLAVSWMPGVGETARFGRALLCRLSIENTTDATIPGVLVEVQPAAAFSVLPERFGRAVRSGELARADWAPERTTFWLTHLPPRFTRAVVLRIVPRVQGKASLPPVVAAAVFRSDVWTRSVAAPLQIGE